MRSQLLFATKLALSIGVPMILGACVVRGALSADTGSMKIRLLNTDGSPINPDQPLSIANKSPGSKFLVSVEALTPTGQRDTAFNGYAHLEVRPGAIASVRNCPAPFDEGTCTDVDVKGRNVFLRDGYAENKLIEILGAHGETRVWAEDLGYVPGVMDPPAACFDKIDNDGDGRVDYPADPGCAFPNDNTEEGGSYATGVSSALPFRKPTLAEGQGWSTDPTQSSAATPFEQEQVDFEVGDPQNVVVTRISSDGFYATDTGDLDGMNGRGFNNVYAFNFNVPPGVRVCDRLIYLAGTASEFFGYTELNFPSFKVHPWRFPTELVTACDPNLDYDALCKGDPGFNPTLSGQVACAESLRAPGSGFRCFSMNDGNCLVPQPVDISKKLGSGTLSAASAATGQALEPFEAGLVVVRDIHIAKIFGPELAPKTGPSADQPNASNCDFNGDGSLDYANASGDEAICTAACDNNPECSEYNAYVGRGNFRIVVPPSNLGMFANIGTVAGVSAIALRGQDIRWLSGTLRAFSGGKLNWTLETRCSDDFIYCAPGDTDCQSKPVSFNAGTACVTPRTESEINDAMD